MSNAALNHVWACTGTGGIGKGLGSSALFVLVVLADEGNNHDGEDWTCWPAIKTIAARTGLGRSTVERQLQALVDFGWLSRRQRVRPDGGKGVYDYTIHRQPEIRSALKQAREAIRVAGKTPSQTIRDLKHPCVAVTGGAPITMTYGQGQMVKGGTRHPDVTPPPVATGQEPLSEPLEEPLRLGDIGHADGEAEWLGEPARTACAVLSGSTSDEFTDVPEGILRTFARDPRLGDGWVESWLSPCSFNPKTRKIHPRTALAKGRIAELIGRELRGCGVELGDPLPPSVVGRR